MHHIYMGFFLVCDWLFHSSLYMQNSSILLCVVIVYYDFYLIAHVGV